MTEVIQEFVNRDLTQLLQDIAWATEIPAEAIPSLLGDLERLCAMLLVRMISAQPRDGQPNAPGGEDHHLLTIPEVAERLGVPKGYVYDLARRGQIPVIRFGKYVRVSTSGLREWVRQRQDAALDTLRTGLHSRRVRAGTRTESATVRG